ncbi:MAG: gp53-like domain-containing protein [Achromobacter sp.]|uniref:gp53-like domain-containing protein n=1 Tax=Achromobacter sp. TaxID=134375 RepID=UPI003CFF90E0
MQASNAPSKSAVPFAQSGTKNTIPVASQIGVTPGAASFTDGFPPLTMTPLSAGGVPPYGADFNGILNFLSAAARWAQAGAGYPYDAAFSTAIGGYPKGAMLKQASGNGYWLNLAENNTTNPDTGGANWIALPAGIASTAQAQALTDDSLALTPKKLADAFQGGNQSLSANGFQKLPGGLIAQWGNTPPTPAASTLYTATLPITYPNAGLVITSSTGIAGAVAAAGSTQDLTTTNFKYATNQANGSVRWISLGY